MLEDTLIEEKTEPDELCALIPKSLLVTVRDEYLARIDYPYAYNVDGARMAAVAINQLIQKFFPEPEKEISEEEQNQA